MIIRKLFKFENAHVVRGCSTEKCRSSIHGHSYEVEVKLHSNFLDNAQMIYDFGLMKQNLKDLVEMFDHSIALWREDSEEYKKQMKLHSSRWVELPVSPSAEQFARVLFVMIDRLFQLTSMQNGEKEVQLYSIVVHETKTGCAEAFREDAYSSLMGLLSLSDITPSKGVVESFGDKNLWNKLLTGERFINPTSV